MEKQYLKRKFPDLVIVEGFWNIGKTALVNRIKEINEFVCISEPDHLKDDIRKNVSEWYEKKHGERHRIAIKSIKDGKRVVMERSLISNLSYKYAVSGKLSIAKLKKIGLKGDTGIVFLYGSGNFILKQSKGVKDIKTKNLIFKKEFYNRYLEFYQKILPKYIDININIIKVDKNNDFKTKEKILSLFYRQFPLLEKEKAVCSSIVAYYKDKILLLYDHKYRHYVLPQGHQEAGEKLNEAALREMTEETGYNNLRFVKKIRKYQYHYPAKDKIIYKSINVYLLEILNLSKVKKSFESHENYSNKFFTFKEAIKNARWPQDKEVIKKSLEYIKKSPIPKE